MRVNAMSGDFGWRVIDLERGVLIGGKPYLADDCLGIVEGYQTDDTGNFVIDSEGNLVRFLSGRTDSHCPGGC
jgi:hypothetical protein